MGPSVREGQMKGGYREMESGLGASFFRVHDKSEEREKKGRGGGALSKNNRRKEKKSRRELALSVWFQDLTYHEAMIQI